MYSTGFEVLKSGLPLKIFFEPHICANPKTSLRRCLKNIKYQTPSCGHLKMTGVLSPSDFDVKDCFVIKKKSVNVKNVFKLSNLIYPQCEYDQCWLLFCVFCCSFFFVFFKSLGFF